MKIKLILPILVLLLFIPLSASAVGIGWFTEELEIPYKGVSCVNYLVYNSGGSDITAYLEVEGGLGEMVDSIHPAEVRLLAGTQPEDGQKIRICFNGKQSANGQVLASSQIDTSGITGSAVGLSSAAPLNIFVDKPNYLLPCLIGLVGVFMILGAFVARKL